MSDEPTEVTLAPEPLPLDRLPENPSTGQVILASLLDPRVEPAKLRELFALQRDVKADEAEEQFSDAMARLQAKLPVIPKKKQIVVKGTLRSKFAAYEDIAKIVRPLLREEGFSVKYDTAIEGKTKIKVIVTLKRGRHKESTEVSLPLDESEYRNAVQSYGATITFAKRYALTLALDIATEDEDNDAATSESISEKEQMMLEDLIAECGLKPAGLSQMLDFLAVKTLSDISRGKHFNTAVNYLTRKRAQLGKQP